MKLGVSWMRTIASLFILLFLSACNLHEVDSGQLYRSAQLDGDQFREVIAKHGIRTVINLRGKSNNDWWLEEDAVMRELGINHINIGMSAKRLPHKKDLRALLEAYRNAERPILIHCQGGADRTGEASAIYQMIYMGKSKKQALRSLKAKYGHLKLRFPAKRYFIKEVWQGEDWAMNEYDPCIQNYEHYGQENCPNPIIKLSAEEDS